MREGGPETPGSGMGRLTTHVLDTSRGRPGAGMQVDLYAVDDRGGLSLLKSVDTNDDGRCDAPLLDGDALAAGVYELRFHAGAYFRAAGESLPDPSFVDEVPIRFGVADAGAHYHVPLLVSPWSYSTYRGS